MLILHTVRGWRVSAAASFLAAVCSVAPMLPAGATLLGSVPTVRGAISPGTWTLVSDPGPGRALPTATLMSNGRVLVTGGQDTSQISQNNLASAEVFDPATNTFAAAAAMNIGRAQHTATRLASGLILIAGGSSDNINPAPLRSAILYNPSTNTWLQTGSMHVARFAHQAVLLHDGRVLVTGGTQNVSNQLRSCEIYNPATGIWTVTGSLEVGRRYSSALVLQNGNVLEAGDAVGAELYSLATGRWSPTGKLNSRVFAGSLSLLANGLAFETPSYLRNGQPAQLYNSSSNSWTNSGSTLARYYAVVATLNDGTILFAGGCVHECSIDSVSSAVRYNPPSGQFVTIASMNHGRDSAAAVTLPDGRVFVIGDFNGNGPEVYTP